MRNSIQLLQRRPYHRKSRIWREIGAILDARWQLSHIVGLDMNRVRKEQVMSKAPIIALVLSIAAIAAPAANADRPLGQQILAQEKAKRISSEAAPSTATPRIIAQERGRHLDARLFSRPSTAPVQVVGPADDFDVRDAFIGGAAALVLALLAAAAFALRRRRQPAGNERDGFGRQLIGEAAGGESSGRGSRRPPALASAEANVELDQAVDVRLHRELEAYRFDLPAKLDDVNRRQLCGEVVERREAHAQGALADKT